MKLFNLIWCDIEAVKKYDSDCEDIGLMGIEGDNYALIYYKFKSHAVIDSRDMIFVSTYFYENDHVYIISVSVDDELPNVKNTVRAELFLGANVLVPINENETKTINLMHMDFKGSVPKFVINSMAASLGQTVDNMDIYLANNQPVSKLPSFLERKDIINKYK